MSVNYKELVEKIDATFMAGDTEGFLGHCTDDVRWTIVGDASVKGKDAVREFMKGPEGCPPPSFAPTKMIADENSVVAYGAMTMAGEDGTSSNYEYCDIYQFAGDKVTDLRTFIVKSKED